MYAHNPLFHYLTAVTCMVLVYVYTKWFHIRPLSATKVKKQGIRFWHGRILKILARDDLYKFNPYF